MASPEITIKIGISEPARKPLKIGMWRVTFGAAELFCFCKENIRTIVQVGVSRFCGVAMQVRFWSWRIFQRASGHLAWPNPTLCGSILFFFFGGGGGFRDLFALASSYRGGGKIYVGKVARIPDLPWPDPSCFRGCYCVCLSCSWWFFGRCKFMWLFWFYVCMFVVLLRKKYSFLAVCVFSCSLQLVPFVLVLLTFWWFVCFSSGVHFCYGCAIVLCCVMFVLPVVLSGFVLGVALWIPFCAFYILGGWFSLSGKPFTNFSGHLEFWEKCCFALALCVFYMLWAERTTKMGACRMPETRIASRMWSLYVNNAAIYVE